MIDGFLHAGVEHPDILWLGVASLGTLVLGIGIGLLSDRVGALVGLEATESATSNR